MTNMGLLTFLRYRQHKEHPQLKKCFHSHNVKEKTEKLKMLKLNRWIEK